VAWVGGGGGQDLVVLVLDEGEVAGCICVGEVPVHVRRGSRPLQHLHRQVQFQAEQPCFLAVPL